MSLQTFVNARFRLRPMTGVDRHAAEVLRRLPDAVELIPPKLASSGLAARAWEGTSLSRQSRSGVLWSPCNTGPLTHPRHVLTLHDVAYSDAPAGYRDTYRFAMRSMGRLSASRAAIILTVSEFSKRRIVESLGIESGLVRVTGNGVSESLFVNTSAAKSATPHFVTVGVVGNPNKNLEMLLRAWKRADLTDVTLKIVGEDRGQVHGQRSTQQVVPGVEFTGRLTDAELGEVLASAVGGVFVPRYEGFGLPAIEAASFGLPLILSRIEPLEELDLPNVAFVEPTSEDQIAAELRRLQDRAKTPDASVAQIRTRYSWDRVASLVSEALNDAAN